MNYNIEQLIRAISRLPGIGNRSARRLALYLLKNRTGILHELIDILQRTADNVIECQICHNLDGDSPCSICSNPKRNNGIICVVEDISDLWAIERSGNYNGLYHIVGGNLSALRGVGPEELHIDSLLNRLKDTEEIILAINATVEGKMTMHYLSSCLEVYPHLKITQLACGIPLGGELDYLDEATLATALSARHLVE
jgi:recombination protein RecR